MRLLSRLLNKIRAWRNRKKPQQPLLGVVLPKKEDK